LLTGPGGDFHVLQGVVADTEDWGLAREIARYRELNNDVTAVALKIEEYQCDMDTAHACLSSCETRLTLARAAERLATLEGIPRKVGALRSG
jgi:hypothetical protein